MTTLTNTAEVLAAKAKFQPDSRGAYATSRLLSGQYAQANQQEWAERGTIEGRAAMVFWIFENSDCTSEDADSYPWDQEPSRILLAEEDEDASDLG